MHHDAQLVNRTLDWKQYANWNSKIDLITWCQSNLVVTGHLMESTKTTTMEDASTGVLEK